MNRDPDRPTRRYRLQRRAERQAETRQRIVEATFALHWEVGPAFATISAIAERAGVERLTVYRHFPDDLSLFGACGAHFREVHPLPDPEAWRGVDDPIQRLRVTLRAVYAYHAATEPMQANSRRDAPRLPALQHVVAGAAPRWQAMAASLLDGWQMEEHDRQLLTAAIGHALDFTTWRDLVRQRGLDTEQAIELMVCLVTCLDQNRAAADQPPEAAAPRSDG